MTDEQFETAEKTIENEYSRMIDDCLAKMKEKQGK